MKHLVAPALLLVAFLCAQSLAGQALELTRDQPVIDSGSINAFAKENIPTFTVATLRNGIPVVMKRATANRILTLRVMLRGHVAFTPVEKAGLEAAMLTMMARGSARYTYADVQRALFEDSASISPRYQSFDGSSLDLVAIDTYFDELFPLFADAFLHPSWNPEEFPQVMRDFKLMKQQSENDPYSLTVQRLHESLFAGHPYAASWEGVGKSLDAITLDDVKSYYARTVGSGRLFIVAVGDFDTSKLVARLDATFGTMPRTTYTRPPVPSFVGKVKPDLLLVPYPQSEGLAYARGDFAMPGPRDPDYAASLVAFDLLSDVLFEIVRTRNGAAYDASAGVHGFDASYGDITVFKSSVPGTLKPLIDQSIAVLTSGRSLGGNVSASAAGKSGIGTVQAAAASSFVPIADALPFYKTKYLAEFYSGEQTNTSIAAQVAWSIIYDGDYRDYLLLMDRIQAVSADDVIRVARKYLVDNPTVWTVLGDPALLAGIKRADFLGSTGN
jgi:zinc protease